MEWEFIVVLVTTPALDEAHKLAQALLERKFAACVSIVPGISSSFWWQNEIDHTSENLLIIKTVYSLFERVVECIKQIHSYTVPEIIALPVVGGDPEYLKWMNESLK